MNSSSQRLLALWVGAASLGLAPAFGATDEQPPLEQVRQFRDQVVVGDDGNGVRAATFQTTVGGPEVRYVLAVRSSYVDETGILRSPPVRSLTITLNDDVVFQSDEEILDPVRVQVALNAAGGELNSIVLAARGTPGAAAQVSVLAVSPAAVAFGGRSILPLAMIDAQTSTFLVVHNAGPSPVTLRVVFFNPDGSLAGRTGPQALAAQATGTLDLSQLLVSSRIAWSRGAVHVQWASREFSRVSAVATFHREPDETGNMELASVLALDDYGPFPVSRAVLRDILGE